MSNTEFRAVKENGVYPARRVILRCPFEKCNTRVIPLTDALRTSETTVHNAPPMLDVSEEASAQTSQEEKELFFKIDDAWDFDNIGVSRPAPDLKQPSIHNTDFSIERLLICSECDKGPLGFAGFLDGETDIKKLVYYLSCSSVLYDVEPVKS